MMHTDVLYDGRTCVEVAEVIMDSGATNHAFNSKEMFVPQSNQPYVGERGEALYVHTGKGQVVIEGVGTVRLYGENGDIIVPLCEAVYKASTSKRIPTFRLLLHDNACMACYKPNWTHSVPVNNHS
jgi:hypothetical protein